jgi:ADP-ribosylglycohydrolase
MKPIERARVALEGLATGDAFGEQLLHAGPQVRMLAAAKMQYPVTWQVPGLEVPIPQVDRVWKWTDDTAMAISIFEELSERGVIESGSLAERFGRRYQRDPVRGYGRGAHEVLQNIVSGTPWEMAAKALFDGQGSCGNGGGMRSAPIGAYFADDLDAVIENATRSAKPTHAHADGIAGAVAVAVAAAATFAGERDPKALLETVYAKTPVGPTRERVRRSIAMVGAEAATVAAELGNGSAVIASDTIPFAVWCAATNLTTYANAMWSCVFVGGDIDTTCAIAGGIIVGACGLDGIPAEWRASREPLPL